MHKQRLIVLFDGTWNDPEDQTNVYKLARSIHDYDGDIRQKFFYDPGVGTSRWSRFRGGVAGWGLSRNLLQGYEWLVKNYSDGDEIWAFGFSRGAYTARSMVGIDPLADLPLDWMKENAESAGLKMKRYPVESTAWLSKPRDSFKEFLKGWYAFFRGLFRRGDGRFYRKFESDEQGKPAVNVTVDRSVWQRWQDPECDYRPPTLTRSGQEPPLT